MSESTGAAAPAVGPEPDLHDQAVEANASASGAATAPERATPDEGTEPPAPGGQVRRPSAALAHLRWLLSVLLIVFFIRTFIGEATIIPTGSMEKTILIGDHVFLNKLFYGPEIPFTRLKLPELRQIRRQQIVAFRYPRDPRMIYVKRVIGLPGDRLQIRNNHVLINGRFLDESYVVFNPPALRENFGPVTIPPDHYFVMGDNRDNSYDSRFWGSVPRQNIVGEPLLVYWSYEASSDDWLREGLRNRALFYADVAAHFFSRTRWSRTGLVF